MNGTKFGQRKADAEAKLLSLLEALQSDALSLHVSPSACVYSLGGCRASGCLQGSSCYLSGSQGSHGLHLWEAMQLHIHVFFSESDGDICLVPIPPQRLEFAGS